MYMDSSVKSGLFGGPFCGVPYYVWDLKGDPNLENYPDIFLNVI